MSEENIILVTEMYGAPLTLVIIPAEGKFGISHQDKIIAEVSHNEAWEQVSGAKLPKDLLYLIYSKIDSFYE